MLVLSRKPGQEIKIGDNITICVSRIAGNRVSIGVTAPEQVRIMRGELVQFVQAFDGPEKARPPTGGSSLEGVAFDDQPETSCLPHSAR